MQTPRKRGGLGHMQIPSARAPAPQRPAIQSADALRRSSDRRLRLFCAVLADETKAISADYGVLVKEMGIPLRGLFIIDPEGNLQQVRTSGCFTPESLSPERFC